MPLTAAEVEHVCKLVDEISGIQWDAEKTYLIETRLSGLLEEFACTDLSMLVDKVRAGRDPEIRTAFINAITTRETFFFRDTTPFDALRHKALPEIIDAKESTAFPRKLRLWSAACSSGQEPYSIGIILRELIEDIDDWDVQILATDISPAALASASLGVYTEFEVGRGLTPEMRNKYFRQVENGWKISDEVRSLVHFQNRNLLEPFKGIGAFDVIFCRNVAIYFDFATRQSLFQRLGAELAPNGVLFAGGSENLASYGPNWKPQYHCGGVFYRPNLPPPTVARDAAPIKPLPARAATSGGSTAARPNAGKSVTTATTPTKAPTTASTAAATAKPAPATASPVPAKTLTDRSPTTATAASPPAAVRSNAGPAASTAGSMSTLMKKMQAAAERGNQPAPSTSTTTLAPAASIALGAPPARGKITLDGNRSASDPAVAKPNNVSNPTATPQASTSVVPKRIALGVIKTATSAAPAADESKPAITASKAATPVAPKAESIGRPAAKMTAEISTNAAAAPLARTLGNRSTSASTAATAGPSVVSSSPVSLLTARTPVTSAVPTPKSVGFGGSTAAGKSAEHSTVGPTRNSRPARITLGVR